MRTGELSPNEWEIARELSLSPGKSHIVHGPVNVREDVSDLFEGVNSEVKEKVRATTPKGNR